MHKVCEACQFGKQSRSSFLQEHNVCRMPLEVVHTYVWGPTKIELVYLTKDSGFEMQVPKLVNVLLDSLSLFEFEASPRG